MRVLVLGGKGMAGHMVTSFLKKNTPYHISHTSRDLEDAEGYFLDVMNLERVRELLLSTKPDIVINCVGILNEFAEKNKNQAILINSYLPHFISSLLDLYGGKLIAISTDCLFSGSKGNYTETSIPDGTSIYARTKTLGEVTTGRHLTLRTSIVGPEQKNGIGLFQWFMKQKGDIKGYTNVFWNGVTTLELSKAIAASIEQDLIGLYQLTAPKIISKYELLKLFQSVFKKNDVNIYPYQTEFCNKTLQCTRNDFQYTVPSYNQMLDELKEWMECE
ncbi:NAD(P)-dependent oxidoreductase [Fictibacillus arsenicus]|uniref:dTDP-4-dehydrorhamnose reductase n=1 Tax=Fictibacillus arsenicus TaxID=255247 RepID=A0A1B1Z434_9BACL|nr:SDR family oxidoreductase [Fictibacillus arsenicus]ANX12079.1 NAD(P)-dependent oxidoreductase [Fictibacillus arsenicus]